jgi:hypothetical protein
MKLAARLFVTPGIVALVVLLAPLPAGGSSVASVVQAAVTTPGSWSAPANVTSSPASRFSVSVNAHADEAFVWEATRVVSPAPRYREQSFIRARWRSGTGRLGHTYTMRRSAGGILPDVALAPDGTAIAVWTQVIRGHYRIVAAVRRPGREFFGRRRPIGRTAKRIGAMPEVAFDRKGNAIVLWRHDESLQWVYLGRGHGFGRPRSLRVLATERRLYVDRRGNFYVVLASPDVRRRLPNGRYVTRSRAGIFLATRRPGGRFGGPERVSPTGVPASEPDVAIGPDGTVAAVWRRSQTGGTENIPGPIEAAVRPPGGEFGRPQTLTAADVSVANGPRVVITSAGEAVAAWQQLPSAPPSSCPDCMEIDMSVRPPGGSFGPSTLISSPQIPGGVASPWLAGLELGDVFALWVQRVTPDKVGTVSAMRPAGGPFGAAEPISSSPTGLVAVASAGNRVTALVTPEPLVFQVVTWTVQGG